ncbi:MAG TPA: IS481 family transposase [Pyrinomonadaceae bacterium]|nr:IS481 family transposase [Pyrinomonadaceae bacterium]
MPIESLIKLQQRLGAFPNRSPERRRLVEEVAFTFGISASNLYRILRERQHRQTKHRSDQGKPRHLSTSEMERYCQIIAAMKIRTLNKKGHHLSTGRAIELLESHGIHTPEGFVQIPSGTLSKPTVNRYLKLWGYDHRTLTKEAPAVRFQADFSNELWQFDLSPSDLKHLKKPSPWVDPARGDPTLMLYSVADDRSGVCYQEYHCVYGEETEAALRFLFRAMSAKVDENFPFQGIPKTLYLDNGPISRSRLFLRVMEYLGIEVMTHLPAGSDGNRTTARSKGKVERPFRTVKEAHETLYHFHEPETEEEANLWLHNYLLNYNHQDHREEKHSRIVDWLKHPPPEGIREMCSWERFCTFAREPETRFVDNTARVSVDGVSYEVDADLAENTVTLWWGLFDNQLFVEFNDQKFGPYQPVGGLVSLHQFRKHKKTKNDERTELIAELSQKLELPHSALTNYPDLSFANLEGEESQTQPSKIAFSDPDPFQEFIYPDILSAKRAISEYLRLALTKLSAEQLDYINTLVKETLSKKVIMERVELYFYPNRFKNLPEIIKIEEKDHYVN